MTSPALDQKALAAALEGAEVMAYHQCDQITASKPSYNWNTPGGGQCSRGAKYTDGKYFYCSQHAKESATVLKKASRKLRDGMRLIREDE